ncbi:uncharacterized protein STEHIDRAFT_118178 [Stereum hirsutum FP-91666 SS1]|uniref:uncharacterized protein n=1 Tax=Stereum hirsutum (strain FP-91666) TaxID=721885 RepID=UPI000440A187|nr:uncharacterized protein STEHIDRAFT_118178 [Stereum hirsutum FP-91666 SS1]EIM90959.1 hypothetical protein STEHIDRAFT_118178 [Stereum hirsutum FP-91666 SS1]
MQSAPRKSNDTVSVTIPGSGGDVRVALLVSPAQPKVGLHDHSGHKPTPLNFHHDLAHLRKQVVTRAPPPRLPPDALLAIQPASSGLLGTPFDPSPRFEYPFPSPDITSPIPTSNAFDLMVSAAQHAPLAPSTISPLASFSSMALSLPNPSSISLRPPPRTGSPRLTSTSPSPSTSPSTSSHHGSFKRGIPHNHRDPPVPPTLVRRLGRSPNVQDVSVPTRAPNARHAPTRSRP